MTPWRSKWRTVFSSVAPIMLQDELLLVWDHPRALDLLRWFSPSETNSIQRLIDKEVTKPNSSTNHYTSPEPVQGRATKRALAFMQTTWRSWVAQPGAKMASGNLTTVPSTLQGSSWWTKSGSLSNSGGRTKDNGQTETGTVLTGYRENPLIPYKDTPAVEQVAQSGPVSILGCFQAPAG